MTFYYHFGTDVTEHDQNRIVFSMHKTPHILQKNSEEIICNINGFGANEFGRGQLHIESHVFYYLRKHISIYVLDNDEKITGLIIFYIHANGTLCIDTLCTPYSIGNGKILMNMVKQIAKKLRIKTICVSSTKTAVGFYTKMQFKIDPNNIECSPYVDMICAV